MKSNYFKGLFLSFLVLGGEISAQVQPAKQPLTMVGGAGKKIAMPQYANGDPLAGGNAGTRTGFHTFAYVSEGPTSGSTLTTSVMGACWGVAYKQQNKKLYVSSVMRRHAGFGSGGIGAIYEVNDDLSSPSLFFTVPNVGTDTRVPTLPPVDNVNELSADKDFPNWDTDAFAAVGRRGLGGIDISEDGNRMYVINLFTASLVEIDITGTPSVIASYPVPTSGRPWAVKCHNGSVFVGTTLEDATAAYIYEFYNGAFQASPIATLDLTYTRGQIGNEPGSASHTWQAWTDTYQTQSTDGLTTIWPQPILSDLEFDNDGSIICGLMDRTGLQVGVANYRPSATTANLDLEAGQTGGDIVRVCASGGSYVFGCDGIHPFGNNNGQGPNVEFYWGDTFDWNPYNASNGFHQEIAQGALVFDPGSSEVGTTSMNPTNTYNSGGLIWLDNEPQNRANGTTLGGRSRNHMNGNGADIGTLIYDSSTPGSTPGEMGKAAGLGDIEMFGDFAIGSVGSVLWLDANGNGVFDAGDGANPGLNELKVELYSTTDATIGNGDDKLISTAYTYTNGGLAGFYQFTVYQTGDYYVKFPTLAGANTLTTANQTPGIDDNSDADPSGYSPIFNINVNGVGIAKDNPTLDAGYLAALPIELLSFEGYKEENNVLLHWITSKEINASHFGIERSYDGLLFEQISTVKAENLSEGTTYTHTDKHPIFLDNRLFYRLKMVDNDGSYKYSNILEITENTLLPFLTLYPNPAQNELFVQYIENVNTPELTVIDMLGRTVYAESLPPSPLPQEHKIDISTWNSGIYTLTLSTKNKTFAQKVCIK